MKGAAAWRAIDIVADGYGYLCLLAYARPGFAFLVAAERMAKTLYLQHLR